MTVAIGLYGPKGVSLLADRRITYCGEIIEQRKLRKAGKYHFVVAGYTVAGDALEDVLAKATSLRGLRNKLDLTSWTACANEGAPHTVNISALVTDGKTLWLVGGDLLACEIVEQFAAIGSGGTAALGALHAGATPEQAIEIAGRICSSCGNGCDRIDVPKGRSK